MPRIEGSEVAQGRFAPLLTVSVRVGDAEAEGPAMIDSGADRSILPAEIAEMLGAPWQALQSGEGHSRGAGGSFETRVLDATLKWRGWLICESVVVAQPGSLPWALLGRSDFFQRFDVRFNWHHNPPWVQVDPVPPRSQTKR